MSIELFIYRMNDEGAMKWYEKWDHYRVNSDDDQTAVVKFTEPFMQVTKTNR